MFPILAATYRAAMGEADLSIFLVGPTGAYKSELAALSQQHYGPTMDRQNLPANWRSTGNALEGQAFAARVAILVIDDFCPAGATHDHQRMHRDADRVLRATGQPFRPAANERRPDPPTRPAAAGDDLRHRRGRAARAFARGPGSWCWRLPGDLGAPPPEAENPELRKRQADAADGLYAASMAGFVAWLRRSTRRSARA